nr:MAG: hypothetical protein [Microvirus sp.]
MKTLNRPIIIHYDSVLNFYKLSFFFRGYCYSFYLDDPESLSSIPAPVRPSVRKHFALSSFKPLPDAYIKSTFFNVVVDKLLASHLIDIITVYLASAHDPVHLTHLFHISKTFAIDCRFKTTLASELSYINKLLNIK